MGCQGTCQAPTDQRLCTSIDELLGTDMRTLRAHAADQYEVMMEPRDSVRADVSAEKRLRLGRQRCDYSRRYQLARLRLR